MGSDFGHFRRVTFGTICTAANNRAKLLFQSLFCG
jgi:hypothetical protein